MKERTLDMTEGHPFRHIILFSLPLMAGNAFQQLYTIVDTAVVGKALGVEALAALGAADWLNWMVLSMIQGLTQGASILMAQEFGAKRYEKLKSAVGNSVWCMVLFSALLILVSQLAIEPVLRLMGTPENIIGGSLLYLRIMYFGVPVVMAYNLLSAMLRALGDGKTPLMAMLVASAVNIVLDLLFVLVLHGGIAGAAAATLIAQGVSCVYCIGRVRKMELLHLSKEHFALDIEAFREIVRLSWPMAAMNLLISVGGLMVQSVVNGSGVLFIAGFTATNKLYGLLEMAGVAYGYSVTTYVGQNLGAKKILRISRGVRWSLLLSVVTSATISVCMFVFGRGLVSCFISGTAEEVKEAVGVAYSYLCLLSTFLPILYLLHVMRSAMQGLGKTVWPMASGIVEFFMRLAVVVTLPRLMGETGIFYAEVLAWSGAAFFLLFSYLASMGRLKKAETL